MAHFAYLIEAKLKKMLMSIVHCHLPHHPNPSMPASVFWEAGPVAPGSVWTMGTSKEIERQKERGHVFPTYCLPAYGLSNTPALADWSFL